jgi:hypothetical protein
MGIKTLVRSWFPALIDLRNRVYNDYVHSKFRNKPIKDVFTSIYNENHWNDKESKSGTGSNLVQTAEVKRILSSVVRDLNCKTILDVPCGDFNWIRDVDFGDCHYYGADIVEKLVVSNSEKYHDARHDFFYADLTSSSIPKVDLIFCRDCLVHLSYEAIGNAIATMKGSGSTYLLTTTFTRHSNRDIVTGNWRPVNLEEKPFSFPAPAHVYNEKCTESDNRYQDKSLGLWKISDIPG